MYEKIQKNKKPKSSAPMFIWVAAVLLACTMTVGMFVGAWYYRIRYSRYVGDLSNSIYYAYNHDSLTVEMEGETYLVQKDNIYTIYATITSRGSGRVRWRPRTEPEAVLTFGDGSYMELWMVKLNYSRNGREYGLLISYVNQDGQRYNYDSDRLMLSMLPIADWQNTE